MATNTPRLSLLRHTTSDVFLTSDLAYNWNTIDASPGIFICTSGSRPSTWDGDNTGQAIYETDTDLIYVWDGSGWTRPYPIGALGEATATSNVSTSTTDFSETAASLGVTVAGGGRRHRISVTSIGVTNPNGQAEIAIYRASTQIYQWSILTGTSTLSTVPQAVSLSAFDQPSAGPTTYSVRLRSNPTLQGTSTLTANSNYPIRLLVEEV